MKTLETYLQEFDKQFELHDLGKDEFTLCHNEGDYTCDGGISIEKGRESEAINHLEKVKSFIATMYREVREEAKEDILELIHSVRHAK